MSLPPRWILLLSTLLVVPTACERTSAATEVPASATSTVISLQGIDCQSCGVRVVKTLKERPGVYAASFDRNLAEVTVQYEASQTGPADFLAVVEQHGYTGIEGPGQGAYIPEIEFDPGLDVKKISENGEAVDIRDHAVTGKVTVFDFYAVWCKPCRQVDHHMKQVLAAHEDVALRKLDVVDWDSALAHEYLRNVPDLPYVVVYGVKGKRVGEISGLHLDQLDAAIAKGRRQ